MVSSTSLFHNLPMRPPTPPREISTAVDDAIAFLDDSNEVERLTQQSHPSSGQQATPSGLSSSSYETAAAFANGKTVGFSTQADYHKIPPLDQSSSPIAQPLKRSPSTKDAKPLKSILKLGNDPALLTPEDLSSKLSFFSPEIPGSFPKMLQSVIQQLGGPSRTLRLDAYLALNGVLKAHNGVPEPTAMAEKMDFIMQCLSRDIGLRTDGNTDTNIIIQALKLTISILIDPKLVETLDDDFRTFLVERSFTVLEQSDTPKPIVKTYMYLLAQQRFHSKIMTDRRTDKLVTALQTIEDRCSGNNVVATRLTIYSRLLEQVPAVMLRRIREWLEHVFHGMLSDIIDVRTRAIATGTLAGHTFGLQQHAGKALDDLFESPVEEDQTYGDYFGLRLVKMLTNKEAGLCVPQIWSAVVLFFRSKRKQVEQWRRFPAWSQIIQKCLNCSDLSIKFQAFLAWNKLIFAVMPGSSTKPTMMDRLKSPICTVIKKHGTDKVSQQVRQYALDTYYNLLHYALRPGLTNEELDNAWDLFVDPILSDISGSSEEGRDMACRVIGGLVSVKAGAWNVNAALESLPIKPENLMRLDPRWVRSRIRKILKLLEPVIAAGMWSSEGTNTTLASTWTSLMLAIADAGSQEVRTSSDLKEAVAMLLNVFCRLWNGCMAPPAEVAKDRWLKRYISLIDSMTSSLGEGPFTEDILSTTQDNEIEVAPTPSHRRSKHHGIPRSPLVILFSQFYHPPNALSVDETYGASALAILRRLTSSKRAPAPRLELLRNCLTNASMTAADATVQRLLWLSIAENAIIALEPEACDTNGQESQSLGYGLRHASEILNTALSLTINMESLKIMETLYDAMYVAAKTGAGDGGVVVAVIEPFAKALKTSSPLVTLLTKFRLAQHILEKTVWPKNQLSFDQARKALWGVSLAPQKASIFDPFDHVYELVVDLMTSGYDSLDKLTVPEIDITLQFFSTALDFLNTSPLLLVVTVLRKTQQGFAIWIGDSDKKTAANEQVSDHVRKAWNRLIRLLKSCQYKNSTMLKALESLLIAGFSSPHKAIVNETIVFWNETFGSESVLEYPAKLEEVLRARSIDAEIDLPTFPDSNDGKIPASLPTFFESQDEMPIVGTLPDLAGGLQDDAEAFNSSRHALEKLHAVAQRSPFRRDNTSSPINRVAQRSTSETPKPRLRHDDSQIVFAPIDSSPLPPMDESQLLTEHQKEIKARQMENVQLFPDLSSSPVFQTRALPGVFNTRLDFTSDTGRPNGTARPGTPTGLPDPNVLTSDDLPSSPTPSSAKDVRHVETDENQEEDHDAVLQDPPSSPPRADNEEDDVAVEPGRASPLVGPVDAMIEGTNFAITGDFGMTEDLGTEKASFNADDEDEPEVQSAIFHFPSDSPLPTLQLQQEAEAAEAVRDQSLHATEAEGGIQKSAPNPSLGSPSQLDTAEDNSAEQEQERVEDSFIGQAEADSGTEPQSQSNHGSQEGLQTSRKPKRPSSTVYTTKKQKKQSPLKRIFSTHVWGQSQQNVDDDMEEEIVVASSRRASAPAPDLVQERNHQEEPNAMAPPLKGGRGRPRKSASPAPSQLSLTSARPLKRKASNLSIASSAEDQNATSSVNDISAPGKARKCRKGQDMDSIGLSQDVRAKRRTVSAVVIVTSQQDDQQNVDGTPAVNEGDDTSMPVTPDQQLADEEAAALNRRPIATPRTLLAQLRGAIPDIRAIKLGSQELREYADVLFELSREVHEAGFRGRA